MASTALTTPEPASISPASAAPTGTAPTAWAGAPFTETDDTGQWHIPASPRRSGTRLPSAADRDPHQDSVVLTRPSAQRCELSTVSYTKPADTATRRAGVDQVCRLCRRAAVGGNAVTRPREIGFRAAVMPSEAGSSTAAWPPSGGMRSECGGWTWRGVHPEQVHQYDRPRGGALGGPAANVAHWQMFRGPRMYLAGVGALRTVRRR